MKSLPNELTFTFEGVRAVSPVFAPSRALSACWVSMGVCAALGYDDPRLFWNHLLAAVESYKDLDASVVGAVEQLIDFVTAT